jgi:hypothetical protein
MDFGTVLDVFIGLAFMFALLSLIASCGQEIVAGFLNWRGTYLSKGIDVILDNKADAKFEFSGMVDWLKAHCTTYAGLTVGDQYRLDVKSGTQPANPVLERVLDVQKHPLLRSTPSTLPSYVPAGNFSSALLGVLRDGSGAPVFTQVETTISALPPGDLKATLTLFAEDAGGDIDKLRARLETWFDDSMDRVGGVYKRLTQYVMLVFGMILAVSLNVNTPHVIKVLWQSPSQRSAIVAAATQAAKAEQPQAGTPGSTAAATPELLRAMLGNFEAQQFPIGWDCWYPKPAANADAPDPAKPPGCFTYTEASVQKVGYWNPLFWYSLYALPGWIMTAIAVSLGAPFWFDLLQNFVNIRNAGAKPNRSDDPRAPGANA